MSSEARPAAVVTGGTDGIGAATARSLRDLGYRVLIVGRSRVKADRLIAERAVGDGVVEAIVTDFSSMRAVRSAVGDLAGRIERIDLLLHAVGVLIPRASFTAEGLEEDFAVSYLSRYLFLEEAARVGLLDERTRLVNIAASAPRVPRFAQMEFASVDEVAARTGMRAHGQAQLANDLLTAAAPGRYGITAVGYGPGAVDTSIRREVPAVARVALRPFYARVTRQPAEAAADVVAAFLDPGLAPRTASFRNRHGAFAAPSFVASRQRQAELLRVSDVLVHRALDGTPRSS